MNKFISTVFIEITICHGISRDSNIMINSGYDVQPTSIISIGTTGQTRTKRVNVLGPSF